jgi:nitrogenase iron protein NifH
MRSAVYGKGGIGKSTVCANLSASLALKGRKVLQIGCDPKHDSTRLVLRSVQRTVLDQVRAGESPSLDDLVMTGFAGVDCVEAGGPEPGVRCADRGILTTFEVLKRSGLRLNDYDVVIYDVLGDVVCGGFAVPLRHEHADAVMLVTSGEFMSIYAANNILRGVRSFDHNGRRVLGIVLNRRGMEDEDDRVERFATAVGLPVIARIPRSEAILEAESKGMTVPEDTPSSELASIFGNLSELLITAPPLHSARPLSDEELERIVLGRITAHRTVALLAEKGPERVCPKDIPFPSQAVNAHSTLFGYAMAGPATATVQVTDAVTLIHGPASCGYMVAQNISSAGRRALHSRGTDLRGLMFPGLAVTNMDDQQMVFGGAAALEKQARGLLEEGPKALLLLTTCASGIIGEDLTRVVSALSEDYPGIPIIPVASDGNMSGDYMQGIINACVAVADGLIDPTIGSVDGLVTVAGEKAIASNAECNMRTVKRMLSRLGQEVHCRYLFDTEVERVRTLKKGRICLPAHDDHYCWVLRELLGKGFGIRFLDRAFPIGLTDTIEWLKVLGHELDRDKEARDLADELRVDYHQTAERLRPYLEGKRIMVLALGQEADWTVEAAMDLGMDVVLYASMNQVDHPRPFQPRSEIRGVKRAFSYSPSDRGRDIREMAPDIVLSTYAPQDLPTDCHYEVLPLCPDVGHRSGLDRAVRWAALMRAPLRERWRDAL